MAKVGRTLETVRDVGVNLNGIAEILIDISSSYLVIISDIVFSMCDYMTGTSGHILSLFNCDEVRRPLAKAVGSTTVNCRLSTFSLWDLRLL